MNVAFLDAALGLVIILLTIFVFIPGLKKLIPKEKTVHVDVTEVEEKVGAAVEAKQKASEATTAAKEVVDGLHKKADDFSKQL